MKKKSYYIFAIVILGTVFTAYSAFAKKAEEISISLSNWEEYFELKCNTEVKADVDTGITQVWMNYGISLKEEFVERVVMEKDTEIKFKSSYSSGDYYITILEGKNEIELGERHQGRTEGVIESSILKTIIDDKEYIYESGNMIFFGAETRKDKTSITVLEEFRMQEINGFIYLYEK